MELSRQEYPALLASLQPSQASTVLGDRVRLINKVNADIADWLQERRRVEELYAQGLRKLANRPQLDNATALGVFQLPWKRIVNATETLAESHEVLAQKIEVDVERPLREYSSKNRELSSMQGVQNDLSTLAKNLDNSQRKVDKAKEKGPKAVERLSSALAATEEINQQWNSRAPFAFEQLQAADEGRLNHLRDVLTQLETHEVDQVERCRQAAESCLNVLLNVETADEVKTFAAKINGGRPVTTGRERPPTASPNAEPLPPPPRVQDDAASERSGRSGPSRAPPAPEPRHSTPLGGLRRLGTVMNRRKSVVQPSGGLGSSEKKHRSPFAPFKRGDSAREMPIPESATFGEDRPNTAAPTQDNVNEPVRVTTESLDRRGSETEPQPAGTTANGMPTQESHGDIGFASPNTSEQPRVDSEGYSERPETVDEITRIQREASGLDESAMNLTIRDQPIFEDEGQAKQAMDDMANTLRQRAQQTGIRRNVGTLRGRRDVRNTVFIPNPPGPAPDNPALPAEHSTSMPSSPVAPTKHVTSPSNATEDHTMSDSTSIRSGHTLQSISGPSPHPDLHEPGLNASILETVNAWFSEGAVTKSFVVGELALAYSPLPDSVPGSTRVRLDNFQVLEKVAANPHFVNELPAGEKDEKRGEYSISLPGISRPTPTVAFKYQIHLDQSNSSAYCPVIFKSAWNLEEFQASAIVFYSLNPEFISAVPGESAVLKNLVLTVNLDTSPEDEATKQPREVVHATGAAMHPSTGATFRRKHSAVIWKAPELEVKPGEDGKFLVRFSTSSSWPRKGKVEAKFELPMAKPGSGLAISTAPERADSPQRGTDPFADEGGVSSLPPHSSGTWNGVPTTRKLVTGRYTSS